jgi:formate dehydrogenase subunit gamma
MDPIAEIIDRNAGKEGPLLPILHDLQAELGYIDEAAVRRIATALNLSRAEVHGVVSFYHDFVTTPDERPVIELCRAEACKARGVEALITGAEGAVGERVRLKSVYCLGLCSVGPAARVGMTLHARLDTASLVRLMEQIC